MSIGAHVRDGQSRAADALARAQSADSHARRQRPFVSRAHDRSQGDMAMNDLQRATFYSRSSEGLREVGVLLIAFTPLDYAMHAGAMAGTTLWPFVVAGVFFFSMSLFRELRVLR